MIKLLSYSAAIAATIIVSGCTTPPPVDPKPTVVIEYKYVTSSIPDDVLEIPPKVPNIDVSTASNTEIAHWMLSSEERASMLETKLEKIGEINKGKSK